MRIVDKIKWIIQIFLPRLCSSIWHLLHKDSIAINVFFEEEQDGSLKHKNWGDDLNLYLLPLLTHKHIYAANKSLIHNKFALKNYSCIGSIIGFYENRKTEIWGSGVACNDIVLNRKPKKVHSVRGKYTRDFLLSNGIECPEIYGDPVLLISRYYKAVPFANFKLGIIPHYNDLNNEIIKDFVSQNKDVLLINLTNYENWSDICDQIVSCDCIISSSLHGIIASDSYGIPNVWVKFSDKVYGGNFKFLDYFSSVNRVENDPFIVEKLEDLYELKGKTFDYKSEAYINYDMILNSCPF